ncbi:MAG: metallophosphoesterase family protein [Christensenellaceae bacterium]|nr:metallophosphoesterase family protein [Christensenellaceae bacterium]
MKKNIKTLLLLVLAAVIMLSSTTLAAESRLELLARNATWKYLDDGTDLGKNWAENIDSSSWKEGAAPLGFGDDVSETDPTLPLATEVSFGDDENNKHMTTYVVSEIDVPALDGYVGIEFYIHVDDGAVVYMNGKEIFRRGIDEGIDVVYTTGAKFKPKEETFVLPLADLPLVVGNNVIAAEVHQDDGTSSDLWFELGMVAIDETALVPPVDYTATALPNPDVEVGEISRLVMTYNGDTSTQMGFTWYTSQASVGTDLEVIPETEAIEPDFSYAQKYTGRFYMSTNAPEYLLHKAVATDLIPGTTYAFRVGDAKLGLWSQKGLFTTDNRDGEFTFINLADPQAKNLEEAELSASTFGIANDTVDCADFMVVNGDIVDTGMKEEQWGWVMDSAKDTLYNLPFMAVAGNHDEDNQSFYEHFNVEPVEGSSTKTGVYFSFDYENTHFIMLNTNEDSPEYADFTPRQIAWLKQDAAQAKENGADWIIAVLHKGPYTTSNHATDGDIMDANGVRTLVAPILAEAGIDLVLQGHDHIYAVSKPINEKGEAQEPTMVEIPYDHFSVKHMENPEGVVYMIPSTAGPKVYYKNKKIEGLDPTYYDKFLNAPEHSAAKYATEEDTDRPPRSIIQNFVEINVTPERITAIVYEIDRNQSDTPYVLDSFGIVKK